MNLSEIIKLQQKTSKAGGAGLPKGNRSGAQTADPGFLSFDDLWKKAGKGAGLKNGSLEQSLKEQQEAVRLQSEEILKKAREEAIRIEQEAFEKGFAEGKQDGLVEGLKKFENAIKQFETLCEGIQGQRSAVNTQYEKDLLVLIKTMVDRLVNHEVSVNPRVIETCLKKAMEFVVENSMVKVHLHPDDFNRIKEAGLENPALLKGKSKLQLIEDPDISLGGCLLGTDFGEIDATLETCREALYKAVDKAFLAVLGEKGPEETP